MDCLRISPEGSAFLGRFASELGALASDIESFQDVLADMLSPMEGGRIPIQSQAMDELSQRAHALAGVAARMAVDGALEGGSVKDLVIGVTLGALAQRLSADGQGNRDEREELQLFSR
jgi:hypothetical protein